MCSTRNLLVSDIKVMYAKSLADHQPVARPDSHIDDTQWLSKCRITDSTYTLTSYRA